MTLEETYASLNEGINDPGIFKAVFMAGGPGSGKSLIAKKVGFQSMGLRPVNSDSSFEQGLKKAGLSLKMPEDEEEQDKDVLDDGRKTPSMAGVIATARTIQKFKDFTNKKVGNFLLYLLH